MELKLVTFELAKTLKGLLFPQVIQSFVPHYYTINGNFKNSDMEVDYEDMFCVAPSIDIVAKWLREVHKCYINIEAYKPYDGGSELLFSYLWFYGKHTDYDADFKTYEEALTAAINSTIEAMQQK